MMEETRNLQQVNNTLLYKVVLRMTHHRRESNLHFCGNRQQLHS